MRSIVFSIILSVFAAVVASGNTQASTTAVLLTAREQAVILQGAGMAGEWAASSQSQFLADVERTIRRANIGPHAQSLRQPVSNTALLKLQGRLASRGNFISQPELRAATDYAHALLVEGNGKVSLAEKVNKLPDQLRKPFHGKVAELAEARARGMVLTKSAKATTWDLTEAKFQPLNYQMKIYARHEKALTSMIEDLDRKIDFNKRGILTKDTLEGGVETGRLVRKENVYRPVGRSDIGLHPSKVFSRPAESQLYANTGRESLIKRGLIVEKSAQPGFQTAGRWLRRGGAIVLILTEGYVINEFVTGRMSKREFVTAQSGIAVGIIGALVGGTVGAMGGPPGIVLGVILGGIGGSILGEKIATGFYDRLDESQKRQVEAFVRQHYGISQ